MKKVLYSIMMVALVLTGCTKWDDAVTEKFADGPSIDIAVTATADSAFTFVITPGAGTTYYSYVVDQADEPEVLDEATLLKGGYSSVSQAVLNTSTNASFTYNMRKADNTPLCLPNTTYQIYAVASDDKGMVGVMAIATVKTTDAGAPQIKDFKSDGATKSATVTFNQNVARGEGKVTGVYYKEFDFANPVTLADDDITVTINGGDVTFSAPDAPTGAHILFSYEAGAFVDEVGNKCGAVSSTVDETAESVEEMFLGIYVHASNANWTISNEMVAPATDYSIGMWTEFRGTITFKEDIFVIDEDLKAGDLSVTYVGEDRTITQNMKVTDWSLKDRVLTFQLPIEPNVGDMVTLNVKEGVLYDVYGNTNNAYTTEGLSWKYVGFIPTKEMILGTFSYSLLYNGSSYNWGNFTIEEYTDEGAEPGDIVIKDFYIEGSMMYGSYDLEAFKVYIYPYQALGILNDDEEGDYGVVTFSKSGSSTIAFDINPDGTLTSTDFILVGTAPDYSELWWYESPSSATTVLVPVTISSRVATSRAAEVKNKQKISSSKKIQLFRK